MVENDFIRCKKLILQRSLPPEFPPLPVIELLFKSSPIHRSLPSSPRSLPIFKPIHLLLSLPVRIYMQSLLNAVSQTKHRSNQPKRCPTLPWNPALFSVGPNAQSRAQEDWWRGRRGIGKGFATATEIKDSWWGWKCKIVECQGQEEWFALGTLILCIYL